MLVLAKAGSDLSTFYGAFTPVCFTLLGLWLVVVQTRHSEWRRSPVHRSRAYTLSANFAMPGMMGLLSLVDPGNSTMWRAAFAVVAVCGAFALVFMALRGPGRGQHPPLSVATTWLAALLYALVALIALAPTVVKDVGLNLTALEVEALILCVLVFIAVNVAWFLMFDEYQVPAGAAGSQSAAEVRPAKVGTDA